MKINLISRDKDSMKLEFADADETVIIPLVTELLNDANIAEVRYKLGHPELEKPTLYIKMKEGKPNVAIKKAAKNISEIYKDIKMKFEKSFSAVK